jgi:hypothetical protein
MIVCSFLPAKIADASFQCLSSVGSFCSSFLYFALPLLKKKATDSNGNRDLHTTANWTEKNKNF